MLCVSVSASFFRYIGGVGHLANQIIMRKLEDDERIALHTVVTHKKFSFLQITPRVKQVIPSIIAPLAPLSVKSSNNSRPVLRGTSEAGK